MKVVVAGASGLIGRALVSHLRRHGHEVVRLIRSGKPGDDARLWNPDEGLLDIKHLKGVDAVVNLAGENIAAGRWTKRRKERILHSRVNATRTLSTALSQVNNGSRVLVNASAIGIYGDGGMEEITEKHPPGHGFFPDVGRAWESATSVAEQSGVRVILARLGVVLAADGGALASMLPIFRLGLGGRIGSGDQFWSWVTLEDVVRAIAFALNEPDLRGPVNLTSPHPVTNAQFTRSLASALHRPAFLPVPGFLARLALGEMAEAALLTSARVVPEKLIEAGFEFQHTELDAALRDCLDGNRDVQGGCA